MRTPLTHGQRVVVHLLRRAWWYLWRCVVTALVIYLLLVLTFSLSGCDERDLNRIPCQAEGAKIQPHGCKPGLPPRPHTFNRGVEP